LSLQPKMTLLTRTHSPTSALMAQIYLDANISTSVRGSIGQNPFSLSIILSRLCYSDASVCPRRLCRYVLWLNGAS